MDRDAGEAGDDLAVGFFLQPRPDRFPVGKAERARQCRGKDGFPDAGVGAGDDEAGHAAAMAAASAPVIASMLSSSTWSVIAMRRRAVPCRTVGGRMPRISKPPAWSAAAMRIVRALSPMATGSASCRDRVCQSVELSVGAASLKTKHKSYYYDT